MDLFELITDWQQASKRPQTVQVYYRGEFHIKPIHFQWGLLTEQCSGEIGLREQYGYTWHGANVEV